MDGSGSRKGRCRRGSHGFTLLELMFAAGIVGMALAFLFGSLVTIANASNLTQGRSMALTHVATVLEELHGMPLTAVLTYTPPVFTGLGPGAAEVVRLDVIQQDGTVLLALPVDPTTVGALPNPLIIRCTVNWTGPGNRPLTLNASRMYYR